MNTILIETKQEPKKVKEPNSCALGGNCVLDGDGTSTCTYAEELYNAGKDQTDCDCYQGFNAA